MKEDFIELVRNKITPAYSALEFLLWSNKKPGKEFVYGALRNLQELIIVIENHMEELHK